MDDDEQLSLAIALSLQEAEYLASTPPKLSQPKLARTNHDALTNEEQMLLLLGDPDEFDRNPDLQAQQLAYWQLQRDAKKARPTHTRRRRETAQVADSPVRRPVPLARYTEPPGRAQSFQSQPRRSRECASCMDQITGTPRSSHCGEHHYCTECFVGMIKAALSGGTFPVQCCGKQFSQRAVAAALGTDKKMSERYFDRIEERETPNPTFCPTVDCGKLIRAQDNLACRSCHKSVCARCKNARHLEPCPDEKMDKAFEELREKEGWKNCPNCHAAVSKIRGTCNKIDCLYSFPPSPHAAHANYGIDAASASACTVGNGTGVRTERPVAGARYITLMRWMRCWQRTRSIHSGICGCSHRPKRLRCVP